MLVRDQESLHFGKSGFLSQYRHLGGVSLFDTCCCFDDAAAADIADDADDGDDDDEYDDDDDDDHEDQFCELASVGWKIGAKPVSASLVPPTINDLRFFQFFMHFFNVFS